MLGRERKPLEGSGLLGACSRDLSRSRPRCVSAGSHQLLHRWSEPSPPPPPTHTPLQPWLPPPDSLLEVEGNTFREALELSGTPFPYFPEMIPQASGDQVIAPTPTGEKQLTKLLVAGGIKGVGAFKRDLASYGKKLGR